MKPGEHKTVQSRILAYAQAIGWTFVPREESEQRRGGTPAPLGAKSGGSGGWKTPAPLSLFFDDLLDAKVRQFNPRYAEAEGALLGTFRHLHTDVYGNREFVEHLRNRGKFFDHEEKRERNLNSDRLRGPGQKCLRSHRGVGLSQWPLWHTGRCRLYHQRHPGAGDRVQERQQGRGERPRGGPDSPLPPRDARAVREPAAFHRHRRYRLFLRGELEHGAAEHFQLEVNGGGTFLSPSEIKLGAGMPPLPSSSTTRTSTHSSSTSATPSAARRSSRNTKRSRCSTKSSRRTHSCAPSSTTTALCPRYTMLVRKAYTSFGSVSVCLPPGRHVSREPRRIEPRTHPGMVAEGLARSVKPAERKAPDANDLPAATHH